MLRSALLAGAALLLGGCLSTKEPVFDATNSLPVGEIPVNRRLKPITPR